MQCKYCLMELEDGTTVCPHCGENQEDSKVSKQLKIMKILTASLASLVLLALLAGIVHYGVTGTFFPRKNDLHNKDSYTVSKEILDTEAGYNNYIKKMDKVVVTFGEHKLTNRMLQIYYWQEVISSTYKDLDKTKPLDTQYQDSETQTTWEQFFIQKAIGAWEEDMARVDLAKAAGYQMPEEYSSQFVTLKADVEAYAKMSGYDDPAEYLEKGYGKGVDMDTFYEYSWNTYYGGLYCAERAAEMPVTQEQIEAYFQSHAQELAAGAYGQVAITKESGKLVDVRHILVKITGGTKDEEGNTVYSEEDWEACRAKAQAILDEWMAGEKTEDSFGKLATEKTEDGGSKQTGGLYQLVRKGQMVKPFEEWCFAENRKTGDTGLVKTTYGYHVMYYVYGEEGWIRACEEGAKIVATDELVRNTQSEYKEKINYRNIVIGAVQ